MNLIISHAYMPACMFNRTCYHKHIYAGVTLEGFTVGFGCEEIFGID